jgi:hypothetical protein
MQRFIVSVFGAGLVILALVATVVAAEPTPSPDTQVRARDAVPTILGLTHEQVMALRHDGLSLAQIAEKQDVDPQALVDALVSRWTERLEIRVANGALTEAQAATLRAELEVQARNMVFKTELGGMQGAAVGAGPGAGPGAGMGLGNGRGAMDRTGPAAANGSRANTMQRGANGICDGTGGPGPGRQ